MISFTQYINENITSFHYDEKSNSHRVLTVMDSPEYKKTGKILMSKTELAAYMKKLEVIVHVCSALDDLQKIDTYRNYFGEDLMNTASTLRHELEGFQILRAMIAVKPETRPIFTK